MLSAVRTVILGFLSHGDSFLKSSNDCLSGKVLSQLFMDGSNLNLHWWKSSTCG